MLSLNALRIALVAALMLSGCASRSKSPGMNPAAALAPIESSVPVAEPPAAAPAPVPVIGRFAIVQTAGPAQLEFRDAKLGDLRAPRSALGDRLGKGVEYGAKPGIAVAQVGAAVRYPPAFVVGGAVTVIGLAVGAVTGMIVGGVEDAVNRSSIPSEKLDRYTARLQAAASDLALGPRALRECVTEQLDPSRAAAQADLADAAEAPNFALLVQQGFSHALTLDAIRLEFVREAGGEGPGDRHERFAVTLVSHYRVHELADPPRVVHTGSARHGSPALRLDRWAAEQAREVHELAARGCPLLAEQVGADLSAKFSLAGN